MDHKDLDVWKKGMSLVEMIYTISSNIAEGSARKSGKELLQFISIALGSLSELATQYMIAIRLGFITENNEVIHLITDEKKLLLGYRNHIRKKVSS